MKDKIVITAIEESTAESPRNDTASILEFDGKLMVVWHKYEMSAQGGSDFGKCNIYAKDSFDGGKTWTNPRMIVKADPGDLNVQAPALLRLPSGEILLICLRAHERSSTSMWLLRSADGGETFSVDKAIWKNSSGQWLQGGASCLLRLSTGRLLIPFHAGTGDQMNQHNAVRCAFSDDEGGTWTITEEVVDLPMRGAMEASVAELSGGRLAMSLRTQLGAVFIAYSENGGESWSFAETTGLRSPESCTCLRRIPSTNNLLLLWNDAEYIPNHHHFGYRTPLSGAISKDEGKTWERLVNILEGDFELSNLGCTFLSNGNAVVTFSKADADAVCCADPSLKNYPMFKREKLELYAALIDRDVF